MASSPESKPTRSGDPSADAGELAVPAALAGLTRHFTGRRWVFSKLDSWLADSSARRLLIVGDAGTGKSALAARLVEYSRASEPNNDWPRLGPGMLSGAHFCRAQVDPTLDPCRVFRDLALQLTRRYPAFAEAVIAQNGAASTVIGQATTGVAQQGSVVAGVYIGAIMSGSSARAEFDRLLRRPLEALCSQVTGSVVLLIDSLDEAFPYAADENLVHVLRAATDASEELPSQVRLLFTSRRDPRVTDRVADMTIDLVADAPPDDSDVCDYAASRLCGTSLTDSERGELARRIAAEGGGNFLYARYVVDDLLAHQERLRDPAGIGLPDGLAGHYREYLQRELAADDDRWKRYRPVLAAVAVAHGDGLTPQELSGALIIRESEVDAVIPVMDQYLSRPTADGRRRLQYQSFRDFLLADDRYRIRPGEASDSLAAYFLDEFTGSWLTSPDPYAIAYTPSHLIEALTYAEHRRDRERLGGALGELLTDLGYISARLMLDRGDSRPLAHDYRQAMDVVPQAAGAILAGYAEALLRYAHVFRQRPADAFVQMVNRLHHPDGPAPDRMLNCEARPASQWLLVLHPLPLDPALRQTLSLHTNMIQAVAVTPDGARAVTAGRDGRICVWDITQGRAIRDWKPGRGSLRNVAISPDGARVLSYDSDGHVCVWEARTGTMLGDGSAEGTWGMAPLPDWGSVLLGREDGCVVMYPFPQGDGGRSGLWYTHERLSALAVTPDGSCALASGPDSPDVRVWRLDGGYDPIVLDDPAGPDPTEEELLDRMVYEFIRDPREAAVLAVSEDGRLVAAARDDGTVRLWDLAERRRLWSCRADPTMVEGVAVTAGGLVLAGGAAGNIAVFDAQSGGEVTRLRGGTGHVTGLALTQDGATLLSAGGEGDLRVWDLLGIRTGRSPAVHTAKVTALAFSQDASLAASGAADGTLAIWAMSTGAAMVSPGAHTAPVTGVAFTPGGWLASAAEDGTVRLWNARDLTPVKTIQAAPSDQEQKGCRALAALDGTTMLVSTDSGPLLTDKGRLLAADLQAGSVTVLGVCDGKPITALAVSSDRTIAVSASADGTVERWYLDGRQAPAERLAEIPDIRSLVLTPDGSTVLAGDLHGIITIFPLADPKQAGQLRGHVNWVDALAPTGQGGILLSGGWDRTLRLWDLAGSKELSRYTWEVPIACAAAGTLDGEDIVAAGDLQGRVFFMHIMPAP